MSIMVSLLHNDWTDSIQLIHLPTRGANFTWSNGRLGNRFTERRLDRAICSQSWLDVCSSIDCTTLVKNRSDHYPLLLDFSSHSIRFMSSFKFMKMWTMHDDCRNVISHSWNERVDVGCPMFVLNSKLKRLKTKLKFWNKEIFGNVHNYVSAAEAHLQHIQIQIQNYGHNDQLMKLEKDAQADLDIALDRQEVFWKERSKIKWQLEGDRNTAYFHRMAKIKNTTKIISSLKHGNTTLTDPSQISDHVVEYYKTLFCTNPIVHDQLLVEKVIPNLVGDNINALLTVLPSAEEIKHAFFDLNKDGAPGPDGFGGVFFQTYWDIIHVDVINAILQFFSSASEAINLLHKKTFCGNLALKIDISKAFDTLNWSFLLKVLEQFGFNTVFCNWIESILSSAHMSISINGAQKGYFKCLRGVRQGDPLSPILFCLAEEVLSRGISNLVQEGKIELIKGSRNSTVPSHCLYADDIMVFCKGKFSSLQLQALQALFTSYASCSGQVINASKSTIFAGGIS
ncbi:ribonuclease H [Trifolium pratense]|uniref:Ribonuclease H n=1 Tax=Trifolium pratense TaxID=57577 RepID=A0A2K3NK54_TRIPR|nr:ribonuclease H [Trifolium pratense]